MKRKVWARWLPMVVCGLLCGRVSSTIAGDVPQIKQDVPYIEGASSSQTADLYLPTGTGPFPTVLLIHGGAWMSGDKQNVAAQAYRLAKSGFVAVSINYRLAPEFPYPAQIDDCRAALAWLLRVAPEYQIDSSRMAVMGYSSGAHLACLLGYTPWEPSSDQGERLEKHPIKAIVAGGTPCDFTQIPPQSEHLVYWLQGTREQVPERYREASPIVWVSADDPATFLYHGERDRLVIDTGAKRLAGVLAERGVSVEFHTVTGAGHLGAFLSRDATGRAIAFLDGQLRPTKPTTEADR